MIICGLAAFECDARQDWCGGNWKPWQCDFDAMFDIRSDKVTSAPSVESLLQTRSPVSPV
jgi:hypothetical protein